VDSFLSEDLRAIHYDAISRGCLIEIKTRNTYLKKDVTTVVELDLVTLGVVQEQAKYRQRWKGILTDETKIVLFILYQNAAHRIEIDATNCDAGSLLKTPVLNFKPVHWATGATLSTSRRRKHDSDDFWQRKKEQLKEELDLRPLDFYADVATRFYQHIFSIPQAEVEAKGVFDFSPKTSDDDFIAVSKVVSMQSHEATSGPITTKEKRSLLVYPTFFQIRTGEAATLQDTATDALTWTSPAGEVGTTFSHLYNNFSDVLNWVLVDDDPVHSACPGTDDTAAFFAGTQKPGTGHSYHLSPADLDEKTFVQLAQLAEAPLVVSTEMLHGFVDSMLPILTAEYPANFDVIRSHLEDTKANRNRCYTFASMANTLTFLHRLVSAVGKAQRLPPNRLFIVNSQAGDMMAVIRTSKSESPRAFLYTRFNSRDRWIFAKRLLNIKEVKEEFCYWQLTGLVALDSRHLAASISALITSMCALPVWYQQGEGRIPTGNGLVPRVMQAIGDTERLGMAFRMCVPLESGRKCEFAGVAAALCMLASNSPFKNNLKSYTKFDNVRCKRLLELQYLVWSMNCCAQAGLESVMLSWKEPVSLDLSGLVYVNLIAFANNRYAISSLCKKNVMDKEEQERIAVVQLAEAQKLHEDSATIAAGAPVHPDRHYLNGGLPYYESKVVAKRYTEHKMHNESLDIHAFVEQGWGTAYAMCSPDLCLSLLRQNLGISTSEFQARKEANAAYHLLTVPPMHGKNSFKSASDVDQEGMSSIRYTSMRSLHEHVKAATKQSAVTTKDCMQHLLEELSKETTESADDCYAYRTLMSDVTVQKTGQPGGDREISVGAAGKTICSELNNNLGQILMVPNDAATWGEGTKDRMMDFVNKQVKEVAQLGVELKREIGQTKGTINPGDIMEPVIVTWALDIKKYAPLCSPTGMAMPAVRLESELTSAEFVLAVLGILDQGGRVVLVSEAITNWLETARDKPGFDGDRARLVLKYLNLGNLEITKDKGLGRLHAVGGKVEGSNNGTGSSQVAVQAEEFAAQVCKHISDNLIPDDASISLMSADGRKDTMWKDLPPEVRKLICKCHSVWCADDATAILVLPDSRLLTYFMSCWKNLLQCSGYALNIEKCISTLWGSELTGYTYRLGAESTLCVPIIKLVRAIGTMPATPMKAYQHIMSAVQSIAASGGGLALCNHVAAVAGMVCRNRFGIFRKNLTPREWPTEFSIHNLPPTYFGPTRITAGILVNIYDPIRHFLDKQEIRWRQAGEEERKHIKTGLLLLQTNVRSASQLNKGKVRGDDMEDVGFVDICYVRTVPSTKIQRSMGPLQTGRINIIGMMQYTPFLRQASRAPEHVRLYMANSAKPSGDVGAQQELRNLFSSISNGFRFVSIPKAAFSLQDLCTALANADVELKLWGGSVHHSYTMANGESGTFGYEALGKEEAHDAVFTTIKAQYSKYADVSYNSEAVFEVHGSRATVKPAGNVRWTGDIIALILASKGMHKAAALAGLPAFSPSFASKRLQAASVLFGFRNPAEASRQAWMDSVRTINTLSSIMLPYASASTTRDIVHAASEMVTLTTVVSADPLRSRDIIADVEGRLEIVKNWADEVASAATYLTPSTLDAIASALQPVVQVPHLDPHSAYIILQAYVATRRDVDAALLAKLYNVPVQPTPVLHFTVKRPTGPLVLVITMQRRQYEDPSTALIRHSWGRSDSQALILVSHQAKLFWCFHTGETACTDARWTYSGVMPLMLVRGYKPRLARLEMAHGAVVLHEQEAEFRTGLGVLRTQELQFSEVKLCSSLVPPGILDQICPMYPSVPEFLSVHDMDVLAPSVGLIMDKPYLQHPHLLASYKVGTLGGTVQPSFQVNGGRASWASMAGGGSKVAGNVLLMKPTRVQPGKGLASQWVMPLVLEDWEIRPSLGNLPVDPMTHHMVGGTLMGYAPVGTTYDTSVNMLLIGDAVVYLQQGKPHGADSTAYNFNIQLPEGMTDWTSVQRLNRIIRTGRVSGLPAPPPRMTIKGLTMMTKRWTVTGATPAHMLVTLYQANQHGDYSQSEQDIINAAHVGTVVVEPMVEEAYADDPAVWHTEMEETAAFNTVQAQLSMF